MKFQPGQSGNPSGRTKSGTVTLGEIRAFAESKCLDAIKKVHELTQHKDPKVALAACNTLLDRGLGKPSQAVEVSGSLESISVNIAGKAIE